MPWREIVIDNCKNVSGKSNRKDKSFLIIYTGRKLTFRITARFHDSSFKWYVDCPELNIYDHWFAVVGIETAKSAKRLAIEYLKRNTELNIEFENDLDDAERLLKAA